MSVDPVKVGVIGCGNICGAYFGALKKFGIVEVTACADLIMARAEAKAEEHGIRACTVKELLADPQIEIVLNLTISAAHTEVNLCSIRAGKNVHAEKPLAIDRKHGKKTLDAALKKDVLVGSAPDTFMGGGIQTCRKLIDDGAIGRPVAATAFMMCHGHESWHPDPESYYKHGAGPMFDMGPYYLTALINLLGPIRRVSGSTRVTFPKRTITSEPKKGCKIKVEVPTHIAGTMDFASGAVGTIITSFDIWRHTCPLIEIYGTEGSLRVPDPNGFGGTVMLSTPTTDWEEVPLTHSYAYGNRGIGVADMAYALRFGRPHRANGEMAFHVLDIMQAFHEASDTGRSVELKTTCRRPAPMPMGLEEGILDEK